MAEALDASSRHLISHCEWSTNEDEVACICISCEGNILTGHESSMIIWSLNVESTYWNNERRVQPPIEGTVSCICQFPPETFLALSVNQSILIYQYSLLNGMITSLSLKDQYSFSGEEINQIDIHPKGSYICSCDDSGEIKVVDVKNKTLLRTLAHFHENICSTVKFSTKKPWELFSGGLDSNIGRWDFNRGRLLAKSSTIAASNAAFMINPPFVHSLDIFHSQHYMVCGLGDGRLAVYSSKSLDLICDIRAHMASVACVRCIEKKDGSMNNNYIVSAGNDCAICMCKLICRESRSELNLVSKLENVPKVNWIDILCNTVIYVFTANVDGKVSVYSFKD